MSARGPRAAGNGDVVRLNYPEVSTDPRRARLTMRDRERDPRTGIPPDSWEFADARTIRLLPLGSRFASYKIYEVWYEATGSNVAGVGFAAVRDLVSLLRYEIFDESGALNPMIGETGRHETGVLRALGFGVSQSGRFLRHFLELGMNGDDRGRRVFDGVLTHVAGAGKVFANHSFAMPGRTATRTGSTRKTGSRSAMPS
jgi:Alpha/beta hydrolase domain